MRLSKTSKPEMNSDSLNLIRFVCSVSVGLI